MTTAKPKTVAAKSEPEEPVTGLTDRQRTKLEKRDAAVAEPDEDYSKCDNHPDRDSVVVTDGVLHSKQAYCDECVETYHYAL